MPRTSAIVAQASLTRRSQRGGPDLSVVDLSKNPCLLRWPLGLSARPRCLLVRSAWGVGFARPLAAAAASSRVEATSCLRSLAFQVLPVCSSTRSSSPAVCCPQARRADVVCFRAASAATRASRRALHARSTAHAACAAASTARTAPSPAVKRAPSLRRADLHPSSRL